MLNDELGVTIREMPHMGSFMLGVSYRRLGRRERWYRLLWRFFKRFLNDQIERQSYSNDGWGSV